MMKENIFLKILARNFFNLTLKFILILAVFSSVGVSAQKVDTAQVKISKVKVGRMYVYPDAILIGKIEIYNSRIIFVKDSAKQPKEKNRKK